MFGNNWTEAVAGQGKMLGAPIGGARWFDSGRVSQGEMLKCTGSIKNTSHFLAQKWHAHSCSKTGFGALACLVLSSVVSASSVGVYASVQAFKPDCLVMLFVVQLPYSADSELPVYD